MDTAEIEVATGAQLVTDLSADVRAFCKHRGDGLVVVFVPHATAGLAVVETGSGTEHDLAMSIDRLLPLEHRYRHAHGSRGHGRDHVLPAFLSPSLTVPVLAGAPTLGTWQSIVLVDSNADNPVRRVRLAFLSAG